MYRIVAERINTDKALEDFMDNVEKLMEDGYTLIGGVVIKYTPGDKQLFYIQTLTKPKEKPCKTLS